jgi:type I restriction enzyme S subunit
MSDWIETNLGELAAAGRSLISGPFGSNIGTQFFRAEGVPVIRGNNLTTDHRRFVDGGFVFVTEDKADDLDADAIQDDLIFTAAGTIGQVGMIPKSARFKRYVISNKQIRFRADPQKVDLDYLYVWLSSPWIFKAIADRDTGSTVPLINLSVVRSLPVSLPKDTAHQKNIGHIFRSIDAKIDLNNRINAELEALAKTIYDYWFVQFDFPDPKGRPYKTSGGRMDWNDALKREIPAGWQAGSLNDLGQIVGGSTPSTSNPQHFGQGMIPWITPKDLSNNKGNKFIARGETDVSNVGMRSASLTLYPAGTVLMSSRAPVGYLAIALNPVTTNQGFKSFVPSKGYGTSFVYYAVERSLPTIIQYASGSTFVEISGGVLKSVRAVLPDKSVTDAFCRLIEPIVKRQQQAEVENVELTQLRDWLLPLLMNGQVTASGL